MILVNANGGLVVAHGSTADLLMTLGWQEVKPAAATPAETKTTTTTRKRTTTRKKEGTSDANTEH